MPRMASPILPDGWHRSPNDIRREDRPMWALLRAGEPAALVERRAEGWHVSAATTDLRGHAVVDTFEAGRAAAELALREGMASEIWARELAVRWSAELRRTLGGPASSSSTRLAPAERT